MQTCSQFCTHVHMYPYSISFRCLKCCHENGTEKRAWQQAMPYAQKADKKLSHSIFCDKRFLNRQKNLMKKPCKRKFLFLHLVLLTQLSLPKLNAP